MKELKSFLSRVNCKIATAKLLEYFNEVDVRQRGELRFDDFLRLYQKLLVANTVIVQYSFNQKKKKCITHTHFTLFNSKLRPTEHPRNCRPSISIHKRQSNCAIAWFSSISIQRSK